MPRTYYAQPRLVARPAAVPTLDDAIAQVYQRVSAATPRTPKRHPTYAQRWADDRVDRYADAPGYRLPRERARRRQISRALAPYFKAARLDQRFAWSALLVRLEAYPGSYSAWLCLSRRLEAIVQPDRWEGIDGLHVEVWRATAAHRATLDPAKVACYPTMADAKRGREVVMSAGRFFAAVMPNAAPAEIQARAEAFIEAGRPAAVQWIESDDPEGWSAVYTAGHGFTSCMSKFEDDSEHPARFYAWPGNGLALAYLGTRDRCVARCVVNRERKAYVRVYGDARLGLALEALGYSHLRQGALEGVRCRATACVGGLVAPYLDAVGRVDWDGASDSCVISSNGKWGATETEGYARRAGELCHDCGETVDEDDIHYLGRYERHVCERCADRNYTYAIVDRRGNREYVRDIEVIEVRGESYLADAEVLSDNGFVQDEDGDWQEAGDCIFLEYLGNYVLLDNCVRLDRDHGDDSYARSEDTVTVELDGEELTVHKDDADEVRAEEAARIADELEDAA